MRARGHMIAGMIAGGGTATVPYLVATLTAPEANLLASASLGSVIGACAAAIPDVVESSKRRGPSHRAFFHSWVVLLSLLGLGWLIYRGSIHLDPGIVWGFVLPAIAGYVSHLVLDSVTEKGLPRF
jgi:membrane-bound metal-dependent hydrolase YbcI (DUF457 family)